MAIQIKTTEQSLMAEINVTPLVDVMLVLLIIFIVTAPLLIQGIPVTLPKASFSPVLHSPKQAQLTIDVMKQIYLDKVPLERGQLKNTLLALHANLPEVSVQLMVDERVPYGEVAKIMATIQQAGINKLVFITASE